MPSLTIVAVLVAVGATPQEPPPPEFAEGMRGVIVSGTAPVASDLTTLRHQIATLPLDDKKKLDALIKGGSVMVLPAGTEVQVTRDHDGAIEIRCLNGPIDAARTLFTAPTNFGSASREASDFAELQPDPSYRPSVGDRVLIVAATRACVTLDDAVAQAAALQRDADEKKSEPAVKTGPVTYPLEKGTRVQILRLLRSTDWSAKASGAYIEVSVLSGTYADQRLVVPAKYVGRLVAKTRASTQKSAPAKKKQAVKSAASTVPMDLAKRVKSLLAQAQALESNNKAAAIKTYEQIVELAPESDAGKRAGERLKVLKPKD